MHVQTYVLISYLIFGVINTNSGNLKNEEKTSRQMYQKMTKINFNKEVTYDQNAEKTDPFSAYVNISEFLPLNTGGWEFEFVIKYTGDESVEVYNPLYYLQFTIVKQGVQLNTTFKAPIPLINIKSEISADDFNFTISTITANGKEQIIKEEVNKACLVFNSGDERYYKLCIPGYEDSGKTISFGAGSYQLVFLFSIISIIKENVDPQYITFKTSPITIQIE